MGYLQRTQNVERPPFTAQQFQARRISNIKKLTLYVQKWILRIRALEIMAARGIRERAENTSCQYFTTLYNFILI